MNEFEKLITVPENYKIDRQKLLDIVNNCSYNKKILGYYSEYLKNPNRKIMVSFHKCENIEKCNKFYLVDRYDVEMIKELRKTNLCKDKFCNNCKKVKQATRMSRYIPAIEPYRENAYHLVLTVPNVHGYNLKERLDEINKAFNTLIRYFDGRKRIKGIDFKRYGYLGAIKSIEITFHDDWYHPHLHVLIVLKSRGVEERIHQNVFSYSASNGFRLFTDLEILIQKIWALLLNGVKVTKKNIDELVDGYSCTLDKFNDDDYAELFKYLTKDFDDSHNILTYNNFAVILESTYRLKQIQGYGCFYQVIDENLDDELSKDYENVIKFLKELEKPETSYESPHKLLNDPYTLISRKKYFKYLNENKIDS